MLGVPLPIIILLALIQRFAHDPRRCEETCDLKRAKERLQVASSRCANMTDSNKEIEWHMVEGIWSVTLSAA
jgi:hypothetical protein